MKLTLIIKFNSLADAVHYAGGCVSNTREAMMHANVAFAPVVPFLPIADWDIFLVLTVNGKER